LCKPWMTRSGSFVHEMYAREAGVPFFNQTANTLGATVQQEVGAQHELYSQANPLPVCHRPAASAKLATAWILIVATSRQAAGGRQGRLSGCRGLSSPGR